MRSILHQLPPLRSHPLRRLAWVQTRQTPNHKRVRAQYGEQTMQVLQQILPLISYNLV